MRPKIVAANWKMNKKLNEGLQLASEIAQALSQQPQQNTQVILMPPFIHMEAISSLLAKAPQLYLGAQNCHEQSHGAFTGEIAVPMLQSVGATFVLVGHSERRVHFGEQGALLARKTSAILQHGLRPIFCCGEERTIRLVGEEGVFVVNQLKEGLFHLNRTQIAQTVIAYEPVWAIGTGESPTPEQVQSMHETIRQAIARHYGEEVAQRIPILYGGSCHAQNALTFFAQPDVDGGLIGKASLEVDTFLAIVRAF